MAGNKLPNKIRTRSGKQNVSSITNSQRSVCNVAIYRWDDTDITKLNALDAVSEKGYSGQGEGATTGNFRERKRIVITNDVIRANITKNKSTNAGQFSLTLKRGKRRVGGVVQFDDIDYLSSVHEGDWIMIYIKKGGTIDINSTKSNSGFKMLGMIQNVRYIEVDDEKTGKPRLEYLITGQDFGSVFDMSIFFNPLLNQKSASTLLGANFLVDSIKSLKGAERGVFKGLTPDDLISKLVGFYLGGTKGKSNLDALNSTNQDWYIPPELAKQFGKNIKRNKTLGVSFIDILELGKIGLHNYGRNGKLPDQSKLPQLPGGTFITSLPSSGTVWEVLQNFQNRIANEMYTELTVDSNGNLNPSIILRQVPFSNHKNHETNPYTIARNKYKESIDPPVPQAVTKTKTYFTNLPKHEILSSSIKEKNIGKSSHERINHVVIVPKLGGDPLNVAYKAIINTPSIQRYGLKSFQGQSNFVLDKDLGDPASAAEFFAGLIVDWFFLSHQLYNGTIIIEGQDEHFEIGNNLYITDIQQLFHIEGYTHLYENRADGSTEYTTEFIVSRGQFFDGSVAKFIGPSSKQQEPTTITTSVLEGIR